MMKAKVAREGVVLGVAAPVSEGFAALAGFAMLLGVASQSFKKS
jgi:hypothetical protein